MHPLAIDLYDGLPGVALFLAYLGSVLREDRYTRLAQAAVVTLRRQVERGHEAIPWIGAFSGWGGLIYALTHLASLWDQPALIEEAEAIVERLLSLIDGDEELDIIGGAAGCIASLLSLYQSVPSERTLAVAVQCGDRLLARAHAMEHGIGWVCRKGGKTPLAGFAHGAGGIAWALLELSSLTGEERFRAAALGFFQQQG